MVPPNHPKSSVLVGPYLWKPRYVLWNPPYVRLEVGPGLRMLPLGPLMGCAAIRMDLGGMLESLLENKHRGPLSTLFGRAFCRIFLTYFIISAILQRWHMFFSVFFWWLRRGESNNLKGYVYRESIIRYFVLSVGSGCRMFAHLSIGGMRRPKSGGYWVWPKVIIYIYTV